MARAHAISIVAERQLAAVFDSLLGKTGEERNEARGRILEDDVLWKEVDKEQGRMIASRGRIDISSEGSSPALPPRARR